MEPSFHFPCDTCVVVRSKWWSKRAESHSCYNIVSTCWQTNTTVLPKCRQTDLVVSTQVLEVWQVQSTPELLSQRWFSGSFAGLNIRRFQMVHQPETGAGQESKSDVY